MGSPLSPIVADIVLQDIENKALYKIGIKLPIYYRYVDDILLAIPKHLVNNIVDIFNSYHSRIQFTYELEDNRSINFLDLKIKINESNQIIIDWYQKTTQSYRYLSFFSSPYVIKLV